MKTRRGFSLVELLVVIALIGILAALATPALSGSMRANKLSATGQAVVDELNLARQTALSRNAPVEVRFYKLPDADGPSTATPGVYRAAQIFLVQGGTATPLRRPYVFPSPVVISPGSAESPLLASTNHPEVGPAGNLPGVGMNYRYRSLRFAPNGSADVAHPEDAITLVLDKDRTPAQGGNFFTVQVGAINGSVRSFRP